MEAGETAVEGGGDWLLSFLKIKNNNNNNNTDNDL
jgi:hypothetical protein